MMPLPATTFPHKAVFVTIVALCGALNAIMLAKLLFSHAMLNTDFMAFWSFQRFVAAHPAGFIYNAQALTAFQQALYPGFHSFYPYLYPPTLLLPTWWLRLLPFGAAEIVWALAGVALLAAAIPTLFARNQGGALLVLLASPAALINAATGETAFFTSALLLAGFGALPRRPILVGIAFGLLTLKPQLGVLIPVFLLARGERRAIIAASATALGLVAVSCAVLPPTMWQLWWQTLPEYQANYFNATTLNLNIIVTPAANLVALGIGQKAAWGVQVICFVLVACGVAWMARRAPYNLAVAALLVGTFLAQPHAYAYDTVTIPAALMLCLTPRMPEWALGLGGLVYLAPLALLSPAAHWFLYSLPLAVLFVSIIILARTAAGGAISAHAPDLSSPTS
jgi:hypothetical protein